MTLELPPSVFFQIPRLTLDLQALFIRMFERLGKMGDKGVDFFTTHPSSEKRVKVRFESTAFRGTDDLLRLQPATGGSAARGVLDSCSKSSVRRHGRPA